MGCTRAAGRSQCQLRTVQCVHCEIRGYCFPSLKEHTTDGLTVQDHTVSSGVSLVQKPKNKHHSETVKCELANAVSETGATLHNEII